MLNNLTKFAITSFTAMAVLFGSAAPYGINYDTDATVQGHRYVKNIFLESPRFGSQSISVNQNATNLLYHDLTKQCFLAAAGETLSSAFDFSGVWMHGYVYLDRGNDGEFSHELEANSVIPAGSDIMSFSNYDGYNSAGRATYNGNVGVNPPAYTLPSDLAPGMYRMRYKVDWNSIDPGGNTASGATNPQLITSNSGAIIDVMVMVVSGNRIITVDATNGTVTLADGSEIEPGKLSAGAPFDLKIHPDNGYSLSKLIIENGDTVSIPEGYTPAIDIPHNTMVIPGVVVKDNAYTVPDYINVGNMHITAIFAETSNEPSEGEYDSPYSGSKPSTEGFASVSCDGRSLRLNSEEAASFTEEALHVACGSTLDILPAYSGSASEFAFYIDLSGNGVYSPAIGELLAKSSIPSFTGIAIPAGIPAGIYRARLEAVGHCSADFLINLFDTSCGIDYDVMNGMVLNTSNGPLPRSIGAGEPLKLMAVPAVEGFVASAPFTVRAGYGLDDPQYIRGNRQWEEMRFDASETLEVPSSLTYGDVMVYGNYSETSDSEWTCIWSDEFDSTEMNNDKWDFHPRYSSTWNKRIAIGDECPYVNKFDGAHYNSYSIPTPDEFKGTETQEIITGAIYTNNHFYLKGGRIEARLRTRGHKGNFPAFWMMPHDGSAGWPKAGEIDIWEQIDDSWTTYHTIHSAWANQTLGPVSKPSPTKSGSTSADPDLWHVYTLEWDADESLKWYVDGKHVFTYTNQHYSEGKYTEEVTWPFGKAFYIILNQSVGDGSWAADGDPTFEYLTQFDYVRCYQRKDALDYYTPATGHVTGMECIEACGQDTPEEIYTLQGIRVNGENLPTGIYIRRKGATTTKILVR